MPITNPGGSSAPAQTDLPALASWVALFEARRLTAVADGTAVSTFTDASGNGRDATQTGSARPVYKVAANGINSQPVLRFTAASSQFMATTTGSASLTASFYMCALVKFTTVLDYQHILCFGQDPTDGKRRGMLKYDTGKPGWNGSNRDITPGNGALSAGTAYFIEIVRSGTAIKVYLNGVQTSSGNPTLVAYTGTVLNIGTNNTQASEFLNGDLAMCGFIGSAPSAMTLAAIRGYVRETYGIAFPAGPGNTFAAVTSRAGLSAVSGFFDDGATSGQAGLLNRQMVASCSGRGAGHLFQVSDALIGPAIFQNLDTGGYGAVDFWDATVGQYVGAGATTPVIVFGCAIGWGNVGCTPAIFDGVSYWEAYDAAGSGSHRTHRIIQTASGVNYRRVQVDGSTGDITFYRRNNGYPSETVILTIKESGAIVINTAVLPTADPAVAGELYAAGALSAGTPRALMVSGG